jgi:hypothetical protein
MKLCEKIEKAKTCKYFNKNHDGNCILNGHAPFDCDCCNTYKTIESINTNQSIGGLMVKRQHQKHKEKLLLTV